MFSNCLSLYPFREFIVVVIFIDINAVVKINTIIDFHFHTIVAHHLLFVNNTDYLTVVDRDNISFKLLT